MSPTISRALTFALILLLGGVLAVYSANRQENLPTTVQTYALGE